MEADAGVVGAGELVLAAPGGAVVLVLAVIAVGLVVADPRLQDAAALRRTAHLIAAARVVHGHALAVLFVDARLTVLLSVTSASIN